MHLKQYLALGQLFYTCVFIIAVHSCTVKQSRKIYMYSDRVPVENCTRIAELTLF